ncbi:Protein tyrosine kinase [Rhizoctonia solani]|uniref:Protein tyrosine kinase n=1 Tax=Rhizoctonia solani TaxID=456999 RepID=A0A8H7I1T3_9AGAM|nr:Protein tyrosine kinase [Rhizoctonia solani]
MNSRPQPPLRALGTENAWVIFKQVTACDDHDTLPNGDIQVHGDLKSRSQYRRRASCQLVGTTTRTPATISHPHSHSRHYPKPTMLDLDTRNSGIGLGLPPHMRSFSPAPPMSAASDGPASPAALFLSAFSSPAPSVRSPSPLPSVISPAMAMFHSPPPVPTHATVALPPVASSTRESTSPTTAGVVAVKIVSVKPKLPAPVPTDAPRGRLGNRAATFGRAATTTVRGRTPDASSDNDGRPIAEEAALWSTLSHEHILPLFSAEESDSLGAWFLFTLYCPAGTLLDLLKRDGQIITPSAQNTPSKRRPSFASSFSPVNSISRGRSGSITQPQPQRGGLLPETAATLFRQVVRGLRYLHEVARVVHRDIKLENVLVDENGGARITDFGLAVQLDEEPVRSSIERSRSRVSAERTRRSVSRHRTFSTYAPPGHGHAPPSYGLGRANSVSVTSTTPPTAKNKFPPGSLPYAAPELLKPSRSRSRERSNDSDKPNPAQDIWALGCVLHALFTGKLPFSDAFEPRLQMKIVRGIWDEGVVNVIPNSSTLIETLRGCLSVDLAERWSIAMVDEYAWAIGIADEEAEREAMRAQRGSRSSLSPHDSVSPALTRQPSSPSRHASPARPSMIPRPMALAKQSPLASGDATPTLTNKQLSAPGCLAAPASTLEILDSASSTPVPVHRDGESSAVSALSSLSSIPQLHTARSFSSVTSSAVPPLSPGSDSLRSPLATRGTSVERTGRAPSTDRLSVGRNSSTGRGRSAERIGRASSRAPSLPRTSSTDRVERAPSTERTRRAPSLGRALSSERFSAKTRPPVDIIQSGSPSSSGPRTPEEVPPQRGRLASRLEVVDEGDHHHVWGGVEVQGYPTNKPDA